MKKASLLSVLLLAFAAQGCIFVSDDDDTSGTIDAGVPQPDAVPVLDQGSFHATWTLTVGNPATPTTCAAQGAVTVSVLATQASTGTGFDDLFDCVDMAGDTAPVPLDDYTIALDILDANDASLAAAPAVVDANLLTDPCDSIDGSTCIINLPNVEFHFTL